MMPHVQDRRVQSLRLTVAAEEDVWRTRVLLEDAFHTASLPGIPAGRLVLVKRFSLGQLSRRHTSASLSRIIDRKFLELALQAVPVDHPSAASSPVVYFRDEVEPFVRLAVRIAANQETAGWFWPIAARGWRATMSRSEGLRTTLFQVAKSRAGPAGVVALVGELHRLRLLGPLLASLRSADASYVMQLCGWAEPAARSTSAAEREVRSTSAAEREVRSTSSAEPEARSTSPSERTSYISRAAQVVLTEWVNRWTAADVRSTWLAAVFLIDQKPVRLLDAQLIERAISLIHGLADESATVALSSSAPAAAAAAAKVTPIREKNICVFNEVNSENTITKPEPVPETFVPTIETAEAEVVELTPTPTPATSKLTWSDAPQLTEFGGFYFLLALMSRFRIDDFLERHPRLIEFDFPKRLLRFAAEKLLIPEDDPVLSPIPDLGDLESSETEFMHALLTCWYRALSRWTQRFARMDFAELVQRRALLSVSPTHLDLFFDVNSVDIRIRRLGLDIDPGWLPWFGRVVSFHYLDKEEIDGCK